MPPSQTSRLLPTPSRTPLSSNPISTFLSKKAVTMRTSTACEACKRRRSRCTGRPPPCQLCRAKGTECIIDEGLDHRRKASTQRFAEQASLHRELLISLIDCLQHDPLTAYGIRDRSAQDVVTFLRQRAHTNAQGFEGAETRVDDILEALDATPREQRNNSRTSDLLTDVKDDFSVATSPTSSRDEEKTGLSILAESASGTEQTASWNPQDALRQTYERWSRYLMLQRQAARLAGSGPSASGSAGSDDEMDLTGIDLNMTRPPISSSPGLQEQPPVYPARSDRPGWHPVLQVIPTQDSEETSMISEDLSDLEERVLQGSVSGDYNQLGDFRAVEILRFVPATFSLDSPIGSPVLANGFPSALSFSRFAVHSVQPPSNFENSPFSRIITDYRKAAREFIAYGNSPIEVLGGDGIVVDLMMRARIETDEFSVSNWACEIWRTFDDWNLYVRLANVLFFTYLMRWTLLPTAEQYMLLPDFLKPSPVQCLVPHHAAIDFLPFHELRNGLIHHFRDWMMAFPAAGISVNWSAGLDHALVTDPASGLTKISQSFEQHVTNLQNWSIGSSALVAFPELVHAGIHLVEGQ